MAPDLLGDDGIVISLGEQHSFPLESVFEFIRPDTLRDDLAQAALASPMFTNRWRWNATRASDGPENTRRAAGGSQNEALIRAQGLGVNPNCSRSCERRMRSHRWRRWARDDDSSCKRPGSSRCRR